MFSQLHKKKFLIALFAMMIVMSSLLVEITVAATQTSSHTLGMVAGAQPVNAMYEPPDGVCYIGKEENKMSASRQNAWKTATGKGVYIYGKFQTMESVIDISAAKTLCDQRYYRGVWVSWIAYTSSDRTFQVTRNIAKGYMDSFIRQCARVFAAFPYPKFITFNAEMNGNWYPLGEDSSIFKQAWIRIHDIFERENAKVAWVFQPNHPPNGYLNWKYPKRDLLMNYYPGDAYVDWFSISCHAANWLYIRSTVSGAMTRIGIMDIAKSKGKPFMFSEMGAAANYANNYNSPSESARAAWLTSFFRYCLSEPNVKAFMYYNYDSPNNLIENQPLLLAAFRHEVANPKFIDK